MGKYLDLDDVVYGHPISAEELKELRKKASQRGGRLQIMREWMRNNVLGDAGDWGDVWHYFVQDCPGAKEWFDEDEIPK